WGCQNSVRAARNQRFAGRTLILAPHTAADSSSARRASLRCCCVAISPPLVKPLGGALPRADGRPNVLNELRRVRQGIGILGEDRPEGLVAPVVPVGLARVSEQDPDQPFRAVQAAPEVVLLPAAPAEE